MSRLRLAGTLAAVALVLIAVLLAVIGGGGHAGPAEGGSRVVTRAELAALEADLAQPVYWAGPRAPDRLELSETAAGVLIGYLPPGASAGEDRRAYLTIGTYPVSRPLGALRRAAAAAGVPTERVAGGLVFADPEGSAYLARPGEEVQVEVFSPEAGQAIRLLRRGEIKPVTG